MVRGGHPARLIRSLPDSLPAHAAIVLALAVLLPLAGCTVGSSEGPTGSGNNTAPNIWSVTASRLVVQPGEEIIISCNASDNEGDELSYGWEKSDGWFADGEWTWQVTWQAPPVTGDVTITARVSDGFELTTQSITVNVNQPPNEPFNPSPLDGASNVNPENTVVSWQALDDQGDSTFYDIYFGASETPTKVASNVPDTSYTRTDLESNKTYYWRVVVKDEHWYQTSGPVWSFTTGTSNEDPDDPYDPYPGDGDTAVPVNARLSWYADDPNGDQLTYDVYFSATSPPSLVLADITNTTYDPPTMAASTTYYWQVVVKDGRGGEVEGPIWDFTTADGSGGGGGINQPPSMPGSAVPSNGATDQPSYVTLYWSCVDPDGDDLTFDIYFGTSSTPPLQRTNYSDEFWSPGYELFGGTQYYWKIIAKDGNGGETEGATWIFTTQADGGNSPPAQPSNPGPADGAGGQALALLLSWDCSDPDSDNLTYDIAYGSSSPPTVAVTDYPTSNYAISGLVYNMTVYWQIIAKDGNGGETSGPIWSFTCGGPGGNNPPNTPSNPSPADGVSNVQPGLVTFTWDGGDPDMDVVTYNFGIHTSEPVPINDADLTTATTTITLLDNTTYYWRVRAEDDEGATSTSPTWSLTTAEDDGSNNQPPDPPFSPYPSDGGTVIGIQIALGWGASDPDLDDMTFDVYVGTSDPPFLVSQNQTSQSYVYSGLEAGETYYWKVVAEDEWGEEASSALWSFNVQGGTGGNDPPYAPYSPDPEDGAATINDNDTFSWSCGDPDDDPLTYDVYLGQPGNVLLVEQGLETPVYVLETALTDDAEYNWYVRAWDPDGANTTGPTWSFTAGYENQPPNPASNPSPADDAIQVSTGVTLSWTGSDPDLDPLTYDVYFGTSGNDPTLVSQGQSETSYNPGPLSLGSSFVWRIDTWDNEGELTTGVQWSFTTAFTEPR